MTDLRRILLEQREFRQNSFKLLRCIANWTEDLDDHSQLLRGFIVHLQHLARPQVGGFELELDWQLPELLVCFLKLPFQLLVFSTQSLLRLASNTHASTSLTSFLRR